MEQIFRLEVDCVPAGVQGIAKATLTANIIPDFDRGFTRPAIVICPGGGYGYVSVSREGEPIARKFASAGFQTFVLDYEVKTLPYPSHLLLAGKAVALVREHAEEWHIDPNKVFVIGFSAGGHLAGSLGVLWNRDYVKAALNTEREHRPNGMILCYPVITSGEYAHRGSFDNLLLERKSEALLKETSLELQVSAETVPAFIWHTFEDASVPIENALLMATALRKNNIPFELHTFPHGGHGLSLANDQVGGGPQECAVWADMAIRWAKEL